jgi:prefoldin alpha subunit
MEKMTVKEEAVKAKYAELRMATSQIRQMQQQIDAVEEQRAELEGAVGAIADLSNAKPKTKMLAPLTDGIFVSATLDSSSELIVNVGGNVCVKKTPAEAGELLNAKQQELVSFQEAMLEELNKLTDSAARLEKELAQMLGEPK